MAGRPASQPASGAQGSTGIQNVAKSWDGCFPPTACSVPRLFCGQRCSIRTDNAHSCTCLRAALCIFILPIFPIPLFLSSVMPTFQSLFLLPSHSNSLSFFFFLFPISFLVFPAVFCSFIPSFIFFFFSHFCVLLCDLNIKMTSKIDTKKVKYSKEGAKHRIFCWTIEANWNVMAHAQKPDFVFQRNGRVHLNRPVGVSSVDCWQPGCAHQR